MENIPEKFASILSDIDKDDLTGAETNMVGILVRAGLLRFDEETHTYKKTS